MASFKQWRDEIEEEKKKKKEQTPQQVNQQTSQQTASSFNKWRYELENNVPETKPKYNQTESTYKGPDPNEPVENLKDAWGKVTSWAKGLFSGQTNQDINTDKTEDVSTVDIDQVEQRRKEILFAEQQVKNIDDRINQIQTEYILNNANVQNPVKPYSSRNFWGYESLTTELSKEEKGKEFLRTIEKNTVDKKNKELSAEKELLNSASIAYKQYAGQLELNTGVEGAIKDAADLENFAKTKVPFLSDIFQYLDLWQLKQVSDKYEVGGYDNLSQFEKALLEDYRAKTLLNQIDRGVPYKAANVVLDMPKYMLEFVATSGLYSAGSTATKKVVSKVVANEIAQNILGSLVGTELRTIAFAPRIGTQMIEYTLPSYDLVAGEDGTLVMEKIAGGDSYDRAFLKALGSVYTETLVENLGGGLESETFKKGITSMFGKMGTITPEPIKVAAKALIGKVAKINNITTQGELRSLMSKYGNFNGLFSEILEEEVSELLQAPIEERKYYNLATPEGQERFLVETLGIAAFSGFAKIPDAVVNMTRNKDDVIDFPDNIKVVPEDAEKINQEGIKQLAEQEVSMEEPVKEEPIKEEPIKEEVPIQNIVHTETQGDVKLDIQQSADGKKYTIYINGKETDYTYGDLDIAIKAGGGMVREEQSLIDLSKKTLENKIQGEYTPAEFNETFSENPVMFKTGDYIVDREGNLKVVVSGNEKYFGDEVNDYLKSINISTLRTSLIGDTSNEGDGYLDYANQVRLATPEEIATIRPEYRVKKQDKPKEVEKEPVRYPTITDTDKSLIMERLKLRYTPDRLSGFFHRMEFGLKPKAIQDAGIVKFMAANKELAAMFPKQIEAWKEITGIKEGSKSKAIGEKSMDLFNALKEQIGDVIDMVEPVGSLWNSKGNVIFISQKRERMGFIDALKSNPLVLNAEEAGNNVIKVTIKSDMLSTKKEEKVEKESKEEDEGQKYVWGTVSVDKRLYHGADNIVYEEQKKWQEVLKVNGTQKELLKHMTRDYMPSEIKEEARQILEDWKQMNQWARSDIFIRKYYKDSGVWDAIMYTNQVPGRESIGNEYMDLKTGEFWSENKDYAQLYARQSRYGNRKKVVEEVQTKKMSREEALQKAQEARKNKVITEHLKRSIRTGNKIELISDFYNRLIEEGYKPTVEEGYDWEAVNRLEKEYRKLSTTGARQEEIDKKIAEIKGKKSKMYSLKGADGSEYTIKKFEYDYLIDKYGVDGKKAQEKPIEEPVEEIVEEPVEEVEDVNVSRTEEANKYLNEALLEGDKKTYMLTKLPDNLVNSIPLLHTMKNGTWEQVRKLKTYFTWLEMNGYITPESYRKAEKKIDTRLKELKDMGTEKTEELRKEMEKDVVLEPDKPSKPKTDKQKLADLITGHKIAKQKKPNIPVLNTMKVQDGQATTTDLEIYFTRPTTLADGLYQVVGKDMVITTTPIEDFPVLGTEETKPVGKVNKDSFTEIMNDAALVTSKDYTRPIMTGMFMNFEAKSGIIDIITLDGFRMNKYIVPAQLDNAKAKGSIVMAEPRRIAKLLTLLDNSPLEINLLTRKNGSNSIEFKNASGSIVVKALDGEFPPVEPIITGFNPQHNYEINKKEMMAALKEIEPVAKQILGLKITTEFGNDEIIFRASIKNDEIDLNKEVRVPVQITTKAPSNSFEAFAGYLVMPMRIELTAGDPGYENTMGLNISYLFDALQSVKTEKAIISYQEIIKPLVISNDSDTKFITKTAQKLAEKKLSARKLNTNAGISTSANCRVANPSANTDDIDVFEKVEIQSKEMKKEPFRLAKELRELFNWVGEKTRVVEGKDILIRKRGLKVLGVYYTSTNNIGIAGMTDFSTGVHEGTHQLDDMRTRTTEKIIAGTGRSDKFRKEMTDIYEALYGNGKREHPLKVRMSEGLAVLIENYVKQPTSIKAQYPNLVKEIIMPKGKFYDPLIGEYVARANAILKEYQALNELDQIGARMTEIQKSNNKSIFSKYARTQMAVANDLEGLRELAIKQGVSDTASDPYTLGQAYRTSVESIIYSNITGNDGYRIYKNGNFEKVLPYNWKTLTSRLEKNRTINEFNPWLVARDQHFEYESLKNVEELLKEIKDNLEWMTEEHENWKEMNEEAKLLESALSEGRKALRENGFNQEKVARVYEEFKDVFKEEAEMYDNLVDQWIEMQYQARLINKKKADQLKQKRGYATLRRQFLNEIVGENRLGFTGKTGKPSFMKGRTGGKQAIIYPTDSAIMNEQEGWHKAMSQMINNSIIDMYLADEMAASAWANRATLVTAMDSKGNIMFPQERDPKFVVGRKSNGKRMVIEINAEVRKVLDYVLTPHNYGSVERFVLAATRLFTKGTTVTYPAFTFTNFMRDVISNAVNTRTGLKPLVGPLKMIGEAIFRKDPIMAENWRRYKAMGGLDRTFFNMYDVPSKELRKMVTQEKTGIEKGIAALEKGLSLLSVPGRYSEIMNRFPEFDAAKRMGMPDIVAMEWALSVTAPFHHQIADKAFVRSYMASLPFLKAGLEGLSQMAQTVKETPEGRKRFAVVAAIVSGAMVSGLASIMMFGSDDQEQIYRDLSPEELGTYIFFPHPDGRTLIKIPVGRELSTFGATLNAIIAEALLDTNYTPFEIGQILTQWSPIQVVPSDGELESSLGLMLQVLPQIAKPAAMAAVNATDYPNIRSLESQTMQYQEPKFRYTQNTSIFAKWMGATFNVSPIKVDYLITGYFGRTSGFITGKPKALESLIDPTVPFIEDSTYFTSGRTMQKYFELKNNLDLVHGSLTSGRSTFTKEEQQEMRQIYDKVYAIYDEVKNLKEIDLVNNTEEARQQREKILKLLEELNIYEIKLPIGETVEGDKVKLRWNSKKGEYVQSEQ